MTFQNIFSSMAYFRDVVSVLPAARLIKASRIFEALQKTNSTVKNQGVVPGVLIVIVVEPATLKKGAACELIGAKKGRNFQVNLFL